MLGDFDRADGLKSICLRYFNAAGADPAGEIGEDHYPETHLIALVLHATLGRRPSVAIYGDDNPTADDTCIQDYVHVADLAETRVAALRLLEAERGSDRFNLAHRQGIVSARGSGYSAPGGGLKNSRGCCRVPRRRSSRTPDRCESSNAGRGMPAQARRFDYPSLARVGPVHPSSTCFLKS